MKKLLATIFALGLSTYLFQNIPLNIEDILEGFSSISEVLFMLFAVTTMFSASIFIAHDIVPTIKYNFLQKEYDISKEEMKNHISRNSYTIEFSDDAKALYNQLQDIDNKILELKRGQNESK